MSIRRTVPTPTQFGPFRVVRGTTWTERLKAKGLRRTKKVAGEYAPEGRITFSQKFACPVSGFTIAEIEPRLFSFNAPQGACPACDGLGEKLHFDPALDRPQ